MDWVIAYWFQKSVGSGRHSQHCGVRPSYDDTIPLDIASATDRKPATASIKNERDLETILMAEDLRGVMAADWIVAVMAMDEDADSSSVHESAVVGRSKRSACICRILGGAAAEEVLTGTQSAGAGGGRGSDLHKATSIATRMVCCYGMGRNPSFLMEDDDPGIDRGSYRAPYGI